MQDDTSAHGTDQPDAAMTDERTTETMALTNRKRIEHVIKLLPPGLLPLVEREMTRRQGETWFDDAVAEAPGKGLILESKLDAQFLLNLVQRYWTPYFRHLLPASTRNYLGELSDVRDKLVDEETFNDDDTGRALDTAERLLVAVGADTELVDKVRKTRLEHQRIVIEAETKLATRKAAAMPTVSAEGLKPWREVLVPHLDVAQGQFNASEYAANLAHVVSGEGAPEYTDPVEFFHRTYLTDGLRDLLSRSLLRISGDNNASPTVNLQTNFGGGKTHSMLALYHLYSPGLRREQLPQEMQELLAAAPLGLPSQEVRRAVFVGSAAAAGQPSEKSDGTKVNTMWGELAWALGGRRAYDVIAETDRSRTSPGSELLQELLTAFSPCLVLIDEWVVYARQLVNNDDLPAGTFETHFSFAQSLTEAVEAVSGAQLVLSIPASDQDKVSEADDNEIGGPAGHVALDRLQSVIHRKADSWRPASADESFEIVRRRLFEAPSGTTQAEINKVAKIFSQFYASHKADFPVGADSTEYEARMRATYPIHPELFARLYEDWSTLERFQRTRGVLRLMSGVIHVLWNSQSQSPVIMPGDIPLDNQLVTSELTHYLEDRWKPIIDTDVDGPGSTPVEVDKEKTYLGQRAVSRRIARTVFMGSAATLKAAKKGLAEPYIRLGMAMPGDTMGNFRTALNTLADRSTHLYSDVDRYWFDTQANITRTAKDWADRLIGRDEEVWAEIVRRLSPIQYRSGDFDAVHIAPQHTKNIPDRDSARLVLLHPQYAHRGGRSGADTPAQEFAAQALSQHDTAQRKHRNMLVFLAPDKRAVGELMEAVREFLGWQQVLERHLELDLSESQRRQAQTRRDQADEKVVLRIGETYQWLLVPEQGEETSAQVMWETKKVDTGRAEDMAVRAADRLKRDGQLNLQQAPAVLHQKLVGPLADRIWNPDGHIAVGVLWALHAEYSYLNRLVNRSVLVQGIEDVLHLWNWEEEGFALATGCDEDTGRYQGLVLPGGNSTFGQIIDTTLLVRPDKALDQRRQEEEATSRKREAAAVPAPHDGATIVSVNTTETSETAESAAAVGKPSRTSEQPVIPRVPTRFYANAQLTPEQYSKNATKYVFEILQHLDLIGAEVEVTFEIQAKRPEGFPEDKVRILKENANILKLKAEFEAE